MIRSNSDTPWKFSLQGDEITTFYNSSVGGNWETISYGQDSLDYLKPFVDNDQYFFQCCFTTRVAVEISNDEPSTGDLDSIQLVVITTDSPVSGSSSESSGSSGSLLAVAIAVPAVIVGIITIIAIAIVAIRSRRTKNSDVEMTNPFILEVKDADILEPIGSGNYGTVYKGLAFGGTAVALKFMEGASREELFAEIEVLERVHHVTNI